MPNIGYLPTKVKYDYKSRNINLYYRKKNEYDLFKFDIPFKYYIYIEPKYLTDNKKRTVDNTQYELLTNNRPLKKVFLDVYSARNILKDGIYLTGEGDLSPEQRFMCDAYYDTDFPTDIQPRIFYLDIETYTTDKLLPKFNHNISEINAITIYDTYTKLFYSWFLLPATEKRTDVELRNEIINNDIIKNIWGLSKDNFVINFYESPKKLLKHFIQFIENNMPDIITAWNAPFDIPYIVRKIYDHFGDEGLLKISPFHEISYEVTRALEKNSELDRIGIIPGIDIIDMLQWYKKNKYGEQQSYSLKYISTMELGESKIVSESGSSDLTYRFDNEFINFCIYNIQDVRLLTLLEDKLKIMNLAAVIRNITKVDYEDIIHETMTIDNCFIMEANRRRKNGYNKILPSKPQHNKKIPYIGAYVKPTVTGRYKWIADLDFSSLYPSIDKTFKLSNETIVGKVTNFKEHLILTTAMAFGLTNLKQVIDELCPKYDMDDVSDIYMQDKEIDLSVLCNDTIFTVEYFDLYENNNYPYRFNGLDNFHKWLEDNHFVILSNGIIVDHNVKNPIVPTVIADLMTLRKSYKNKMFEYEEKKEYDMASVYNTYQKAAKVLNNSCFTEEHEVITLDGIKNIKEIENGAQLVNFNYIDRKMEVDIVINTIAKPYTGHIYNLKKDMDRESLDLGCYDFSVTNDHKFVLENQDGQIVIKTAEEIYEEYQKCADNVILYHFPAMNNSEEITHDYEYSPLSQDNFDSLVNAIISDGHSFSYWDNTEFDYHFFSTNKKIPIKKENLSRDMFSGNVYCITTEKNHTLMAGKNHKFAITHNCYGVVAKESFRMYNINIASGITSCGQSIIRASTYYLNNYVNSLFGGQADNIIASDTDSIIFTLQNIIDYPIETRDEEILKKISNIAVDCQNYINNVIFDINRNIFNFKWVNDNNNFLNIKNEWVSNTGLFVAKKNYAINMVFNEGHPKEELVMMGMSLKRSTMPEACKPYIREILQAILDFKDKETIDNMVINSANAILSLPLRDISLAISINNIDDYKVDGAHVRGAKIWNKYFALSEMDKIKTAKIKMVYVKKWNNINIERDAIKEVERDKDNKRMASKKVKVHDDVMLLNVLSIPDETKYWEQVKDAFVVDIDRMKERLVIKNIDKFYAAMQWEIPPQLFTDNKCLNVKNIKKSKLIML